MPQPLPRTATRRVAALAALIVLAALTLVGGTAVRVWAVARGDARPASDVLVVLGASQYDGRPSSVLEARLEHARDLYNEGVARRVVTVGGGAAGDRTTEADAGAAYLQQRGVDQVLAVPEGRDTLQSLRALRVVMAERGWSTAVLVTDPWHALRARRMARDLGMAAESSPTRSGPSVRTRGTQLRYIARETAAYLYYRAFGRSTEGGPSAV